MPLDFAEVGLALVGVPGDGEDDGVRRSSRVQDEADRLAVGIVTGQDDGLRPFGLGPGWPYKPKNRKARAGAGASAR